MEQELKKNIYIRNWLKEVRSLVGDGFLHRTFGAKTLSSWKRRAFMWTSEGEFEATKIKNPVEALKILLEHLLTLPKGRKLASKYAIFITGIVGGTFTPYTKFHPNQQVEEECLEDYPELVRFHQLITENAPIEEIEFQVTEVKREIDETLLTVKHYRKNN